MDQLGFKPLAVSVDDGHLDLTGHLNGHPMKAMIDTGADFTTFDSTYVQAVLGHDMRSLPFEMMGLDGRSPKEYQFLPNELDMEGIKFAPILIVSATSPSFAREGFTGLLGVDLLATHSAIIDLGSDTLWLK
jgi:hypothetical protein